MGEAAVQIAKRVPCSSISSSDDRDDVRSSGGVSTDGGRRVEW